MNKILTRLRLPRRAGIKIPISTNLVLSFLLIITVISITFMIVGIQLIGNRIVAEAQEKVRNDLNAAREIYLGELRHIDDVVHLTADRFFLRDTLLTGDIDQMYRELAEVQTREDLDILTVTDATGRVMLRVNNRGVSGDDRSQDNLVEVVLIRREHYAATHIIPAEELRLEGSALAEQAYLPLQDTPLARQRDENVLEDGMMLKAAAPILDYDDNLIGVLYGGVLLNRNYAIVDTIKETVYEGLTHNGKDTGTATIFQDDVRISTNVLNQDQSRAVGTRVSSDVYSKVVLEGERWVGRAYVVNDWYITAYEPIRDIYNKIIGILYVGVLEQRYVDVRQETVLAFTAITWLGSFAALLLAFLIARRISVPIVKLAEASKEIARGNLEVRVERTSQDELGDLAESFNAMASSLQDRDTQLAEFTKSKIMESERLALIGQLAANVAHELNNPLQGIVTYAHLLLEKLPENGGSAGANLDRIVTQANRCRDIIRGLLDFSRQRKPDKTICDLNTVVQECVTLVENQATFHNIEIVCSFDPRLPKVVLDPSQVQQVILNMVINAAEAMRGGGRLTLTTRVVHDQNAVELLVSDTGEGIHPEDMEKLFDPFFTTKEVGHGTGLGLAISYGIVKEHGGRIQVDSELNKGTTFTIRLPIQSEEA